MLFSIWVLEEWKLSLMKDHSETVNFEVIKEIMKGITDLVGVIW